MFHEKGNTKNKGLESKGCLVCLRSNKKASLAILVTELGQIRVLGNETGEVVRGQII